MMSELALNILDIAQNSIRAEAKLVKIEVVEDDSKGSLLITIHDNGKGMSEELLASVTDPFITTRSTRKIGLGISFFKQAAEMTGGTLTIKSKLNEGTSISASFDKVHIDCQPLGDIGATIVSLISLNPAIDFEFTYILNQNEFVLKTEEIRQILGEDAALGSPAVIEFLREYIAEHIDSLR